MIAFPTEQQPAMRRLKMLAVTADTLVAMCKLDGKCRLSAQGMPPDAKVFGVRMVADRNIIELVIESESFPEVKAGDCLQYFSVSFTKHFDSGETVA